MRTGANAVANEFFSLVILDIKDDIAELVLLEYCARFSNPLFTPSLTALIARDTPENNNDIPSIRERFILDRSVCLFRLNMFSTAFFIAETMLLIAEPALLNAEPIFFTTIPTRAAAFCKFCITCTSRPFFCRYSSTLFFSLLYEEYSLPFMCSSFCDSTLYFSAVLLYASVDVGSA